MAVIQNSRPGFITVTAKPPVAIKPVADFSATPLSGKAPLKVKFTDQSTGTAPYDLCLGL